MSFLIIDQYAEQYRQRLSAAFPDRSFVAVPDAGAGHRFRNGAEGCLRLGRRSTTGSFDAS